MHMLPYMKAEAERVNSVTAQQRAGKELGPQ